jgi:hypothetical protein
MNPVLFDAFNGAVLNYVHKEYELEGNYALDERLVSSFPPADYTISRIGELANCNFQALVEGGATQAGAAD